jgi:transposase
MSNLPETERIQTASSIVEICRTRTASRPSVQSNKSYQRHPDELVPPRVRDVLVPTLRIGDVVAMDNLGSHKVPGVHDAIEAAGATLAYIPAYSPDLNPIEMVFAKIKSVLRKKALRTVEGLWKELGEISDCISPTECRNYLQHAGYFQSR